MNTRRNKANGWGVENRSNVQYTDLSQELLQPHWTLDLFILSSQLQEDFLNIHVSSTEAGAWYMLDCLVQICSWMNLSSHVLLCVFLLDNPSISWIFSRHSKLNVIKIELVSSLPILVPPTFFFCPINLFLK